MQNGGALYLAILPIGFGIMTLVVSLICLVGFLTSTDPATKSKLWPWFGRFLVIAFILLSLGLFFTSRHF